MMLQRTEQEKRDAWNAYQREYRRLHPERVRAWRDAAVIRRAEKLLGVRLRFEGGAQNAGN